jgi:transposase
MVALGSGAPGAGGSAIDRQALGWQTGDMLPAGSAPTTLEEAIALLRALWAEVVQLRAENARLTTRVRELEARLGQHSANSSRPPSSDPPQTPRRRRAEPSGRPPGGQAGHERHLRMLRPVEEVDRVTDHWPATCAQCRQPLPREPAVAVADEPSRHQVTEIPPMRTEVTEHRRHRLRCPACGSQTLAPLPPEVPTGAFGPRAQAVVTLLNGRYRLSRREVAAVCAELFGLPLSVGAVDERCQTTGAALADPVAELVQALPAAPIVNVDETGWKAHGQRCWLWVGVTALATVFAIAPSRGRQVLDSLLGADFAGYVGSDRYSAYSGRAPERRPVCWAHLRRDFQSLVDYGGRATMPGRVALVLTDRLFHRWHQVRDDPVAWAGFAAAVQPLQAEFRALLELGAQSPVDRVSGLCQSLLKVWPALWTFATVPGIEPTNNVAERALRPAVLWRKGSFGTQNERGSQFVGRMLTVTATCRQQGRSLLDYLTAVCTAAQQRQPIPSLLPTTTLAQAS